MLTAPIEPVEPAVEQPADPTVAPEATPEPEAELPDWVREKISKANREAQSLRTRLREVEPLAQEAQQRREAEMTELQRATARAEAAEQQLSAAQLAAETNGLAAQYAIPPTHFRYIVGATPEERAEAARGIAELLQAQVAQVQLPAAPPSNRPVQQLLPGASPTPPSGPPTEYPAWWIQKPRPGAQ